MWSLHYFPMPKKGVCIFTLNCFFHPHKSDTRQPASVPMLRTTRNTRDIQKLCGQNLQKVITCGTRRKNTVSKDVASGNAKRNEYGTGTQARQHTQARALGIPYREKLLKRFLCGCPVYIRLCLGFERRQYGVCVPLLVPKHRNTPMYRHRVWP